MPSKLSIILIASLALNAALLGIVGGRLLSPASAEPTVQMQLERYGPTSDVVAAAWAKLPEADRGELRKQLREGWLAMAADWFASEPFEAGEEQAARAKRATDAVASLMEQVWMFMSASPQTPPEERGGARGRRQ